MAALAGEKRVILTALAAMLIQQSAPVPIAPAAPRAPSADIPASVERLLYSCRRSVEHRRLRTAQGFRVSTARALNDYDRTVDDITTRLWTEPSGCQIVASVWRPDGEKMAETVRDALVDWSPTFTVSQWRVAFANEKAPTVQTTFEQRDAEGQVTGALTLIEPADGATGEASVAYQIVTP